MTRDTSDDGQEGADPSRCTLERRRAWRSDSLSSPSPSVVFFINRSLEIFTSLLGTWIPFVLIFPSTYVTGLYTGRKPKRKTAAV